LIKQFLDLRIAADLSRFKSVKRVGWSGPEALELPGLGFGLSIDRHRRILSFLCFSFQCCFIIGIGVVFVSWLICAVPDRRVGEHAYEQAELEKWQS
jgi:hypothetical protein